LYEILVTPESKRELSYWLEKLSLALSPHEGAIKAENNLRPMPYCIVMGGPSGCGKTTLVRYIASMILLLSGECTPENALENLWQKGTTEYWNGYIGQKCLVFDDCFQVKGKPGDSDSEAMQFIRAVGNWSMPLNFADLANKGKIYMDSPLIVGTTNCANIAAEWAPFITEPKALVRRFQGAFWVELDDRFKDQDGRFDFKRVNQEFSAAILRMKAKLGSGTPTSIDMLDCIPWHVWKIHKHGFDRETISDELVPGGLRAIVETAAREIVSRKADNRRDTDEMREMLSAIAKAMTNESEIQPDGNGATSDDDEGVELQAHQCHAVSATCWYELTSR
jgi:energy-coupling factor transporter ATP-binding protein EcfA2